MTVHLSRQDARRIAVRAQLLDAQRPDDLLPILHDDRLIGKLDATANHEAGTLVVHAIHEDAPFSPAAAAAMRGEVQALADWLGLRVELDRR